MIFLTRFFSVFCSFRFTNNHHDGYVSHIVKFILVISDIPIAFDFSHSSSLSLSLWIFSSTPFLSACVYCSYYRCVLAAARTLAGEKRKTSTKFFFRTLLITNNRQQQYEFMPLWRKINSKQFEWRLVFLPMKSRYTWKVSTSTAFIQTHTLIPLSWKSFSTHRSRQIWSRMRIQTKVLCIDGSANAIAQKM